MEEQEEQANPAHLVDKVVRASVVLPGATAATVREAVTPAQEAEEPGAFRLEF